MSSILKTESGFASIEALGAAAFVVVILTGGLAIAYLSFARVYIDRSTYEAAVCLATSEPQQLCEQALRRRTSDALPLGAIVDVHLQRRFDSVSADLKWSLSDFVLTRRSSLSLPLLPSPALAADLGTRGFHE